MAFKFSCFVWRCHFLFDTTTMTRSVLGAILLLLIALISAEKYRFLAWNVGNTDLFGCYKSKLCDPKAAQDVASLVDKYQPDVILFSELCDCNQLMKTSTGCSR